MNNNPSSLKWDRKPPPMEEATPDDKFQFLQLVRSDETFWENVKFNVGLKFPQDLEVEILGKAKEFEKSTLVYISPEDVSDVILLMRMAASGHFDINDDDIVLNKLRENRF